MRQLTRHPAPSVRCPLCLDDLHAAPRVVCRGCYTSYHSVCSRELGGCPTLGCTRKASRRAPRRQRTVDIPEWRRQELRRQVREEEARRLERRRADTGAEARVQENLRGYKAWRNREEHRMWAYGASAVLLLAFWILAELQFTAWPFGLFGFGLYFVGWLLDRGNPNVAAAVREDSSYEPLTGTDVLSVTGVGLLIGIVCALILFFSSNMAYPLLSVGFALGIAALMFVVVGVIYIGQRVAAALRS